MSDNKIQNFSIGELARISGHAPSAVRYYESLGLISSTRTSGGQRRYGPDAVQALKYVAFAQAVGFKLSEIAELNKAIGPGKPLFGHWRELAQRKLNELDDVITHAKQMKRRLGHALECQCVRIEACPLFEKASTM